VNRFLGAILVLFVSVSFSAVPVNSYELGYELVKELTVNVTTEPVIVTLNTGLYQPKMVDYVEIYPQQASITDLWFDARIVTEDVIVWKPVGNQYSSYNNISYIDLNRRIGGIKGVVLKKTAGSSVVGVSFYKRTRLEK